MSRLRSALMSLFAGCMALCLAPPALVVYAQNESCPDMVEAAIEALDTFCTSVGRNQVCYGNVSIQAEAREDVEDFAFEQVGDVEDVSSLQSMKLQPLNEDDGVWGVAMMKLQANLPDTSPGQNVTFLLFGDVEIETAVEAGDDDFTPMQAFYLTTGISDASCEEAPDSGLLVQTPDGASEVTFNVNGVDVAMGSTVLFQAEEAGEMIVSTVEGSAIVEHEGELHAAVAGTRLRWEVDRDLRPLAPPALPETYETERLDRLPVHVLERRIEVMETLPDERLDVLHERLLRGERPCGAEGLPDCDRLPVGLGENFNLQCVPERLAANNPNDERPICEPLPIRERGQEGNRGERDGNRPGTTRPSVLPNDDNTIIRPPLLPNDDNTIIRPPPNDEPPPPDDDNTIIRPPPNEEPPPPDDDNTIIRPPPNEEPPPPDDDNTIIRPPPQGEPPTRPPSRPGG